jgi:hypothetical protein
MGLFHRMISWVKGGAPPAPSPVKDSGKEYDFTKFETPRFRYKVESHKADGTVEVQQHSIDMDAALIDLQSRCGGIFKTFTHKGQEMSGHAVLMDCYRSSEPTPQEVPLFAEVDRAVRKVFELPDSIGMAIAFAILDAYIVEAAERSYLKKEQPVSPDSSAPIPA